ncbi:hypothetical protein GC163_18985 [bacterium]|nr:hypothetical protein [bacterium]
MRAYSKEFRREVLAACDAGGKTRAVAAQFQVSEAWVRRIKQERREQGKTAPCLTRPSHANLGQRGGPDSRRDCAVAGSDAG